MSYPEFSSFGLSFLPRYRDHKSHATLQALPTNKAQPVEVCPLPYALVSFFFLAAQWLDGYLARGLMA
jgi:hypothetical protein